MMNLTVLCRMKWLFGQFDNFTLNCTELTYPLAMGLAITDCMNGISCNFILTNKKFTSVPINIRVISPFYNRSVHYMILQSLLKSQIIEFIHIILAHRKVTKYSSSQTGGWGT